MTTTRKTFLAAALIAVSADLATKVLAVSMLTEKTVDLGLIELRLVHNEGVSFGLGTALPWSVLVLLTSAVVIALGVAVWRGAIPAGVPAGLTIGGATANIIDRLIGGSVIDMLDLGWWPAFNLADVFIVGGAALLLLTTGRSDSPS